MFNFAQMFATPQAREMVFKMMAGEMSKAPPEVREALSRVPVSITKHPRGFELEIGVSDNPQVEEMIQGALGNWSDMLTRGFQAMGYKVTLYE